MRKLTLILVLSCASWGFAGAASAASLKASDCRPLTAENAQGCCAAANLRSLLTPKDQVLCRTQATTRTVASPATALGSPPGSATPLGNNPPSNPPGGTPGGTEKGINNGFGNGDQNAPGNSGPNNNAENANPSRSSPGDSGH